MEHSDNGVDNDMGVVPRRLELLYPEFLAAVLDGIREDSKRMAQYRKELTAACDKAKRKVVQLLEDWTSAHLEDCERAKISEAHTLSEKAAKMVFLSESLFLFNSALSTIEEARQMYLARLKEEARRREEARRQFLGCLKAVALRKSEEEEARRKAEDELRRAEEERIRQHDARMAKLSFYLIMGLMAVVILQAVRMHWSASVLGLLASFLPSFLWRITAHKNRIWLVILGTVGFLAIPTPFVSGISHQLYLVGIPVGVALLVWLIICCVVIPLTRGHIWARLLLILPMLARWCEWFELDGSDWAKLLRSWPRFADKCDWSKLDGIDWATLLGKRPQFADKCDWSKLGDLAWGQLLQSQPQFASRRRGK